MTHITKILIFMLEALKEAWPFIVISIPLSVVINVTGAGEKIKTITGQKPLISIFLATLFGAISPLCSCTVIPVIFSLLTAGVPLGPVMSFWLASPSMDPEIFFLSASTLGWPLAIWRLAATFILSLSAGFLTHLLVKRGWLANGILRANPMAKQMGMKEFTGLMFKKSKEQEKTPSKTNCCSPSPKQPETACCSSAAEQSKPVKASCCTPASSSETSSQCCDNKASTQENQKEKKKFLFKRIREESLKSLLFVGKFMIIAYFVEALIVLYLPPAFIENILGRENSGAVFFAALLGLPFYTTNLAALGLMGGLLQKGMLPGGVLAFLISGPTTTLPAMSAVFGIAKPKVFGLYLGFVFLGAILFGFLYNIFI